MSTLIRASSLSCGLEGKNIEDVDAESNDTYGQALGCWDEFR